MSIPSVPSVPCLRVVVESHRLEVTLDLHLFAWSFTFERLEFP